MKETVPLMPSILFSLSFSTALLLPYYKCTYGMVLAQHGIPQRRGGFTMEPRVWPKLLIVAAVLSLAGCMLPHTTRTAVIHDVKIDDELSSETLMVQPGDEIRWVNMRKMAVQLDIPNLASDRLSCQRGFRNWMGQIDESVSLQPNETVSLCFKAPTVVHYNVRAETALAGGKKLLPGTLKVGQPQLQSSERTRD